MAEDTVNGGATNPPADTNRAHQGSLDVHAVRAQLDALRSKHGADTPIGHRCSNLIEQLRNYERGTGDRWAIEQSIAKSMADLERLAAAT